jgi:hypothetical protein
MFFSRKSLLWLIFAGISAYAAEDSSRFKISSRDELIVKIRPLVADISPICGLQLYQEDVLPSSGQKIAKLQRAEYDLSKLGWLYRSQITDNLTLLGSIFVSQFLNDTKESCHKYQIDDLLLLYIFRQSSSIVVSFMKPNYPSHLAIQMMRDFTGTKSSSEVSALFKAYNGEKLQNDSINSVTGELVETKKILIQDLEKLVIRGEKLEDLQEQAEQLVQESEKFKQQAKKFNRRCCWLL